MSGLTLILNNWITIRQKIAGWLRPPKAPVIPTNEPEALVEPEPEPQPQPIETINRSQRRKVSSERRRLERARIKRDKLVTPNNLELLETIKPRAPRVKAPSKPINIVEDSPDEGRLIVGELVEGDGQGNVLFEESEFKGEFNFRDSILEQLDRYWVYIERMKKYDPDAYDLYTQIGGIMAPYCSIGANFDRRLTVDKMTEEEIEKHKKATVLTPWFKKHRPTFGCITFGANPLDEEIEDKTKNKKQYPKFIYFTKYRQPPPELQPMLGGDIYKLTIWWDRQHDKKLKWGRPTDCGIFVSQDGNTIKLLRQIDTKKIWIRRKHGHYRGKMFSIPQRAWHIPDIYKDWAADHGITADLHLTHLFTDTVKRYEQSCGINAQITIHKDNLTAIFGIDPRRTAYFFRDRDVVVNDGSRQRILHSVREHTRHDGTPVKSHYRGAREFTWAGYKVLITIPGLHHIPLGEFNLGATDSFWFKKGDKYKTEKEIGEALSRHIHGESIEQAFK